MFHTAAWSFDLHSARAGQSQTEVVSFFCVPSLNWKRIQSRLKKRLWYLLQRLVQEGRRKHKKGGWCIMQKVLWSLWATTALHRLSCSIYIRVCARPYMQYIRALFPTSRYLNVAAAAGNLNSAEVQKKKKTGEMVQDQSACLSPEYFIPRTHASSSTHTLAEYALKSAHRRKHAWTHTYRSPRSWLVLRVEWYI